MPSTSAPVRFEAAVLKALSQNVDLLAPQEWGSDHALALIEPMDQMGMFDWQHPVGKHEQPFVIAWCLQNATQCAVFPTVDVFERMERATQGACWAWRYEGRPLWSIFLKAISRYQKKTFNEDEDATLAYLIARADEVDLRAWRMEDDLDLLPYYGSCLNDYLWEQHAVRALQALDRRGWPMFDTSEVNGKVLDRATLIESIQEWSLFLDGGGDPFTRIKPFQEQGGDVQDHRLVAYLWRRSGPSARTDIKPNEWALHLRQWLLDHAPDVIEQESLRRYWHNLTQSQYKGSASLKSRPDWPTLVNEKGQSAMMVWAWHQPSSIDQFLDVKKGQEGAALKDSEGRSLWPYTLAALDPKSSKAGRFFEKATSFLVEHVPLTVDHQGRGVAAQLWRWQKPMPFMAGVDATALWTHLRAHSEAWWGVPQEADKLADETMASVLDLDPEDDINLHPMPFMRNLVHAWDAWSLPDVPKKVLQILGMALVLSKPKDWNEKLKALLDQGLAQINLSDDMWRHLNAMTSQTGGEDVLKTWEAASLREVCSWSMPQRSRLKSRL